MRQITKSTLYRALFDRSVLKDQAFLKAENYGQELEYVYKPFIFNIISRYHLGNYISVFVSLLLGYFIGNIFCYFTFVLMVGTAWSEFKFVRRDKRNLPDRDNKSINERYFTNAVYSTLPLQLLCLVVYMLIFVQEETTLFEKVGAVLSAGYIGALFGINSAHELIHRQNKVDQFFGGVMLSLECYATFKVEHIRGHHANVATPLDASSAPLGMSIYRFLPRAWVMNPINAFRLEAKRLRAIGLSPLHWKNELIWWALLSLSYALIGYLVFGLLGVVFFIAQSFVAITVLETINYVEHYGLERKKLENGRYERATHLHSWNASEKDTNAILLNLQRHSDHHANPAKPYQLLFHNDESPQLPTGYFGMIHLAFWPKKWFEVMDPLAKFYSSQKG